MCSSDLIRVQGGDSHAGYAYFAQPVDILLVELCAAGEIAGPLAVVDALRCNHAIPEAGDR